MSIFEFTDFRLYLKAWIALQPRSGRGLLSKWAQELQIHPSLLSQVLKDRRSLSLEIAAELTCLLNLDDDESNYFLDLVLLDKAGNQRLKNQLQNKIEKRKLQAKQISERLKVRAEISDESKSIYYSSWHYTGLRNLVGSGEISRPDQVAKRLHTTPEKANEVLQFLIDSGLLIHDRKGLAVSQKRLHIGKASHHVNKHHQNWRMQGFNRMENKNNNDLFFTFPFSIASEDVEKMRSLLLNIITEVNKVVEQTTPSTVRCLNIDFFEF